MQSHNFILEKLNLNHASLQLEYYSSNKKHLESWEPQRSPNKYFTLEYQKNKITELSILIKNGQSMHFIILNKSKSQMIGACNYTKIKDGNCWLGYSISKEFEGHNFMYEALKLTNIYVINNLNIKEIRAGILPNNERSLKLINRLDFKYVGEKDELEINGEMRTYNTYLMSALFCEVVD